MTVTKLISSTHICEQKPLSLRERGWGEGVMNSIALIKSVV